MNPNPTLPPQEPCPHCHYLRSATAPCKCGIYLQPPADPPKAVSAVVLDEHQRMAQALKHLCQTRQAAANAKKAFAELAAKLGKCEGVTFEEDGPYCYQSRRPKDRWCDICKAKQPAWENYHSKASAAGAALRAALRLGKTLIPLNPQPDPKSTETPQP